MKKYDQLDSDPLGRICLAYLCLTTSNPQALMPRNLPSAFSQAGFNTSVRIPELLATLGSPDVALADRNGILAVVIVRRQHEDAVFSRIQNSTRWNFSTQPLEVVAAPNATYEITWGPGPEHSIVVDRVSDVWSYINRHHSDTLIAQTKMGHAKRIEAMLEKLRQPII